MQTYIVLAGIAGFLCFHLVSAAIQNEFYSVNKGYEVTSFYKAINVSSITRCAISCNISMGCFTAMFDSQTHQYAEICMNPPAVTNGRLEVNLTSLGSYADLICDANYQIAQSSPTIANCTYGEGWDNHTTMMCVPANTPVEYFGTSFVFAFMQNRKFSMSSTIGDPTVIITSLNTSVVTLDVPYLAMSNVVTVQDSITLNIDKSIVVMSSGIIEDKIVYVRSDTQVHVTILNFDVMSSDGTTVLPVSSLGQEYFVACFGPGIDVLPEFLIASIEDSTLITINYETGAREDIIMNAYNTYLVTGNFLTGTKVSSNKPIFLISGHMGAKIPADSYNYLDFISEMMPPVTSLGTTHIVSFMHPRNDFTVSIVATMNDTEVTVLDNMGNELESITDLMESSSVFRTYFNSMTISVVSNKPILVHQYGHSSNRILGDPSMMFIPDVKHYAPQYYFYIPHFTSTLVIVLSSNYSDAFLELNGQLLSHVQQVPVIVSNNEMFTVIYVVVYPGSYKLTHQSPTAVFGAWVYGRNDGTEFAWSLGYV
ncbi:hypothetical protein ACF0H5_017210 [Mactra antiquata]